MQVQNPVLVSSKQTNNQGIVIMPQYTIEYSSQETLPQQLERKAKHLGISPEQLIKRFVVEGMRNSVNDKPAKLGSSLQDFLEKNDAIKS